MDFGTRSERLVGLATLYVDSLYSTKSFTSFSSSDSLVIVISFFVGVKWHSIPPLLDYPKTYQFMLCQGLVA